MFILIPLYTIATIFLIVLVAHVIMKYAYLSDRYKYDSIERKQFTDSKGIVHKITYDRSTGHIILYTKSNGEYYKFRNDKEGRLVYYEDHDGTHYRCAYNSKGQLAYHEDYVTGERHGYSYAPNGKLYYHINYNTGLGKWYYYDEKGEVYHIKYSDRREEYPDDILFA